MYLMKICLETSAIIGFLNDEPDCQAVEKLLTLAENHQLEIFVSNFAWDEQLKPLNELGNSRKERLARLANPPPKLGEGLEGARSGFNPEDT